MPKTTKSAKNFSKNKSANIKQKKLVQKVKQSQKIKEKKLLERDFSDSDNEVEVREERHISLLKGLSDEKSTAKSSSGSKKEKAPEKKHEVTAEEIAEFWKKLEANRDAETDEEDEEVNKLISTIQDDYDVIELDKSGNIKTDSYNEDADEEDNEDEAEDDGEDEGEVEGEGGDTEDADNNSEEGESDEDMEDESTELTPEEKAKKVERLAEKKFSNLFGFRISQLSKSEEYVKKVLVTKELSQGWIEGAQEGKKNSLKQLLVAFYTASLQFGERSSEEESAFQLSPFRIDSPSVYMRVVLGALRFAPDAFWKLMNIPSTSTTVPSKILMRKKKILALVVLYCKSTLRIFSHTSKADALKYALHYLIAGLPFFASNITSAKSLIKIILKLLQHMDEVVRVRAFMVLHEIASKFPKPIPDLVLKGIYYSYFEFGAECTPENIKRLEFYRNCIGELYGVNFDLSYKHAYTYIRGLAETFQTAAKDNSVQKRKALINWRFVNCLECWTHVLSTYPANDELGDLIFPFTQLLIGIAVLFKENGIWTPLRLRIAGHLNKLSEKSKSFIPSSVVLLSMLKERQIIENKREAIVGTFDFSFKIRVSEKVIRSVEFQRSALSEWVFQIAKFLHIHSRSISFPEIAQPVLRAITSFRHDFFGQKVFGTAEKKVKVTNSAKFLEQLKSLQKTIEDHINTILQKRSKITFSPQEILQSPEKADGLIFEEGKAGPLDKYFNELKKHHDADLMRRMLSYQDAMKDASEKKDEVDVEIEKTIKASQKASEKEEKKEKKEKREKRKRESSAEDKKSRKSRRKDEDAEVKSLSVKSFFD